MGCSREDYMITASLAPRLFSEKLDPRSIDYTTDFYLLENLTTRLVSLDENGNYQLDLADSIKKTGEKEFEIKVKKSSFSNGSLITLEDVKATIDRAMKFGTCHTKLSEIIEYTRIDNDRLIIKLKKNSKSFFYYLSLPDLGILSQDQAKLELLTADSFREISSGPFSYGAEGSTYYLKKNKHHFYAVNDYPDKIVLLSPFDKNISKLILSEKINLGQINIRDYLNFQREFKSKNNLTIIGVPSDSLTYIYINKFSKFKESHRKWLKSQIIKNFNSSSELSEIVRITKQYFPLESKAYLNEDELKKELEPLLTIPRPLDFPDVIRIHTFTTVYDVTVKKFIDKLTEIPGLKIEIINNIKPTEYIEKMKKGEFDIFLNIMSTDLRTPVEAINFEFFSNESPLRDVTGVIKENFSLYQNTNSEDEEIKYLKEISKEIIRSNDIIPLFHSASPFVYDSSRVDLEGLNHLFIMNFWKIKKIK